MFGIKFDSFSKGYPMSRAGYWTSMPEKGFSKYWNSPEIYKIRQSFLPSFPKKHDAPKIGMNQRVYESSIMQHYISSQRRAMETIAHYKRYIPMSSVWW